MPAPPPPGVSIIVPTFRESRNIAALIARIDAIDLSARGGAEVVIVDDNSRDGTEEIITKLARSWVRIIVRTTERGLSSAILAGCRQSLGKTIVVMDADLSHPPEAIPALLRALDDGADMAIGSRYVVGGSTDATWSMFRWLNSKVATLLARPFTNAKDPMSGFFAIRRETLARGTNLQPIGYKIGLEILVKCGCQKITEVPIRFTDRTAGESKLTFAEQARYLRHLARLMVFKVSGEGTRGASEPA